MTQFVTVEGRTLAKALKIAVAIVERRNTIPILSNVRLTRRLARLEIASTDLDIMHVGAIDMIDAEGDFDITVAAHLLEKIARLAGPAPIRIEIVEEKHTRSLYKGKIVEQQEYTLTKARLLVADGDAAYTLDTCPPSDFPELTVNETRTVASFTNGRAAELISIVAPFISTEETRYYLNGIHMTANHMEATDGHRLCRVEFDKEQTTALDVIIPRKVCALLLKFAGPDLVLEVSETQTRMVAKTAAGRFTFKLIDGTYPDTVRVIPRREDVKFTFDIGAANMRTAVERVMTVKTDHSKAVRIHEQSGEIAVTASNPEMGDATARAFDAWPEDAIPFGLNGKYLLDILPKTGRVKIHGSEAGAPFLVDVEGQEDTTRVIMPMRV
jgi:DNA polymerase-3 subunit beta